jgi:hypothetical protein
MIPLYVCVCVYKMYKISVCIYYSYLKELLAVELYDPFISRDYLKKSVYTAIY